MNGTNHDVSLRARARRLAAGATIVLAGLAPAGASAHQPGVVLRAFGAATIDGIVSPGEWDGAAQFDFSIRGTPASLSVMNDAANLYVLVRIAHGSPTGRSTLVFTFDNDHDGQVPEEGQDGFVLNPDGFPLGVRDTVLTGRPPCPAPPPGVVCGLYDTEAGGTNDGSGASGGDAATTVLEASHPLDSADDLNDVSLAGGATVGFLFTVDGVTQPGPYPTGFGDIVVATPDTTPPDTQITGGPENGSFAAARDVSFGFTGTDDDTQAAQLAFECSVDGSLFSGCSTQAAYASLAEGAHTFAVRARDRAGNVDPTPATRIWTVDTTPPQTSLAETPRSLSRSRTARFAFAGTDASGASLTFECALDGDAPSVCTSPHPLARLADGMHTFRVRAVDRAGNRDATWAEHRWVVDATAPRKPTVRGPRSTPSRRPMFRFASRDYVTPAAELEFRCAVDSRRLRACAAVYRARLHAGRHLLRVVAVDEAGNVSAVARFVVVVRKS